MVTDAPSKVQQSGIGILSILAAGPGCDCGVTMIFVAGSLTGGRSISGWVFFSSTAGFAGVSDNTVMRAVSFLGECVVIGAGAAPVAVRTGDGESGGDCLEGGRLGR